MFETLQGRANEIGEAVREWVAMDKVRGHRLGTAIKNIEENTRTATQVEYEYLTQVIDGGVTDGITPLTYDLPVVPQGTVWEYISLTAIDLTESATGLLVYVDGNFAGRLASDTWQLWHPFCLTEGRRLRLRSTNNPAAGARINGLAQVRQCLTPAALKLSRDRGDSEAPRIEGPYNVGDAELNFGQDIPVPDERTIIEPANVGEAKEKHVNRQNQTERIADFN